MHVLCMIPTMAGPGGAERTMSYLVNDLVKRHAVTLLTLDAPGARSFYPLSGSLQQVRLNKLGGRGFGRLLRLLSRPIRIRREVRSRGPDIIVSFMDTMNVTAIMSCLGLGLPIVVSERNDPALNRLGYFKELLRDRVYWLAQEVVTQTGRAASYFPPALQPKIKVIPNPVPSCALRAGPDKPNAKGRLRVIAVGRLEQQKGFDQLIEAFASVADAEPDWDLSIIGEGTQRSRLERLIKRFALGQRVEMVGIVRDVWSELAASHIMAFPSRYEGFPNALAEGLAVGLPAVAYRGVSGVEDLVIHGKTGLLLDLSDGSSGLARALSVLMNDARLRYALGNAAREHVAKWSPSEVLALWEKALIEAARLRRNATR
jgi:glycosyltransferase involved in cell wall biosynthesis